MSSRRGLKVGLCGCVTDRLVGVNDGLLCVDERNLLGRLDGTAARRHIQIPAHYFFLLLDH
jgi:hypothetical protein